MLAHDWSGYVISTETKEMPQHKRLSQMQCHPPQLIKICFCLWANCHGTQHLLSFCTSYRDARWTLVIHLSRRLERSVERSHVAHSQRLMVYREQLHIYTHILNLSKQALNNGESCLRRTLEIETLQLK